MKYKLLYTLQKSVRVVCCHCQELQLTLTPAFNTKLEFIILSSHSFMRYKHVKHLLKYITLKQNSRRTNLFWEGTALPCSHLSWGCGVRSRLRCRCRAPRQRWIRLLPEPRLCPEVSVPSPSLLGSCLRSVERKNGTRLQLDPIWRRALT